MESTLKVLTAGTNGLGTCFKAFQSDSGRKESHLLEISAVTLFLILYGRVSVQSWEWSSYGATAKLAPVPDFLSTD